LTFDHNFGKYRSIFKILSLTDSLGNSEELLQCLSPHGAYLSCVATLPCEIQKSKITVELLLMPSKLIGFT